MPIKKLKENATQEEINEYIVEVQEEYNKLENNLAQLTTVQEDNNKRIAELTEANQKLFLRITTKQEEENTEEIPSYLTEELFGELSDKDKKLMRIIEKGEDE